MNLWTNANLILRDNRSLEVIEGQGFNIRYVTYRMPGSFRKYTNRSQGVFMTKNYYLSTSFYFVNHKNYDFTILSKSFLIFGHMGI